MTATPALPDTVICNTTITRLGFVDRLRVLISGNVRTDMRIYCDSVVRAMETEAVSYISWSAKP